jgi:hypothetical protein
LSCRQRQVNLDSLIECIAKFILGIFLRFCASQMQRREGLKEDADAALLQCYYCLYGVRLASGTQSLSNHQSEPLAFNEEVAAEVFALILPMTLERIQRGTQFRADVSEVLESIYEVFPKPPFHIGKHIMILRCGCTNAPISYDCHVSRPCQGISGTTCRYF